MREKVTRFRSDSPNIPNIYGHVLPDHASQLDMEDITGHNNGQVPLAQKEGLLGSTPEEGGDTTKDDRADDTKLEMGSGNRIKNTSGSTGGGRHPDEGLDEENKNLGGDIQQAA
jgi:hypothetical protein